MAVQSSTVSAAAAPSRSSEASRIYAEGINAGILGAAAIAIWFFVLDAIAGRPFFTPSILGSALFRRGVPMEQLPSLPVSLEMVLMYTWVHGLVFCVIGGVAAKLLSLAERNVNFGFGVLLFFVIFEFGFVVAGLIFAEPVLHALVWPAVLLGNLLAASAMGLYFWHRHPALSIWP
ncbi:MAG TPA: hypothetical protein VNN77_06120 [candidate division Zixibacteria bacterium]|nr:hypothetical protein [candidate division Zixibacteria bacterium]